MCKVFLTVSAIETSVPLRRVVDLEAEAGMAPEKLDAWMNLLGGLDHVVLFHGYLGEQEKAWTDKGELARILSACAIS